jgi:non-ribosomal peptide synthetase component F
VLRIPVANRDSTEFAQLIGLLVDTLVLRSDLSGDPPFREALARVGRTLAEALTHRALGFERIVEIVNPTRALDHDPLFQVTVNWRDREFQLQQLDLDGLRVAPVKYPMGTARFDLTLSLIDAGDRIHGEAEYRSDLWDASRSFLS